MAWNQYDPQYAFVNPAFFPVEQNDSNRQGYYSGGVEQRLEQPHSEQRWQYVDDPATTYQPTSSNIRYQSGYEQATYQPGQQYQPAAVWSQTPAQTPQAATQPGWWPNAGWPQGAVASQQPIYIVPQGTGIWPSSYANSEQYQHPGFQGQPNTGAYRPADFQPYQRPVIYQPESQSRVQQSSFGSGQQAAFYGHPSEEQGQQPTTYPAVRPAPSAFRYPSPVQAVAGYVNPSFAPGNELRTGLVDNIAEDLTDAGENPRLYVLPQPQPTPQYMASAYTASRAIPIPRKLLIVLDLNGTLLVRNKARTNFVGRPNVQKFLNYVLRYHKVVVWSSAQPFNVTSMVEKLLTQQQRDQLVAIWARDKLQLGSHYNSKVQVYKQLSWLWSDPTIQQSFVESEAGFGTMWDATNTVLIDDSVDKAASEPHNLLKIDEFTREDQDKGVEVLAQVVDYLERLRWQSNACNWMKNNPFYVEPTYPGVDWKKLGLDEV